MADGQVIINTKLNDKGLKQGITNLQDTSINALKKVKGVLATVGIGVGVASMVKGINNLIKGTADLTDRIDKQSQKIGLSRRAYQEWDFILSDFDVSVDGLQMGLKTLSMAMDEANKGNKQYATTFDRLKVDIHDTNGALKDQETIFNEVFDALSKMENQTERTAVASRLLGRNATELAPALNAGAEEIEFLKDRAYELNAVLDDTAIDIGVNFGDQLGRMQRAIQTASARAIAPFMDDIANLAVKLSDEGVPAFEKFLSTAIKVGLSVPPIFSFMKAVVSKILEEIGIALDEPWNKLKGFIGDLVNMPIVEKTISLMLDLAGDLWSGLKKGVQTGDWSEFWSATIGAAKFAITVLAGIKLAEASIGLLWGAMQGALAKAGFVTAGVGVAGVIAMAAVAIQIADTIGDPDKGWESLSTNLIAALTAGLGVGAITKSPTLGMYAFTMAMNIKLGEIIGGPLQGLVDKLFYGSDLNEFEKQIKDIINAPLIPFTEYTPLKGQQKKIAEIWGLELGQEILRGLGVGLEDMEDMGIIEANKLLQAVRKELGIRSPSKEFELIGNEIVAGLENGIAGMDQAGEDGAQGFLNAVQDALGVHSESKEGHRIGNEFVNGLINGLVELMPDLKAQADELRAALADIWADKPTESPTGAGAGASGSATNSGGGGIWGQIQSGWKAARDEMSKDIADWSGWAQGQFMQIGPAFGNALSAGMRSLGENILGQRDTLQALSDQIENIEYNLATAQEDLADAQTAYNRALLSGDQNAIKAAEKRLKQQQRLVDGHQEQLNALKEEKKSVEDGTKSWKDFARTILGALADTLYGLGAELAARAAIAAVTFNWGGAAVAAAGSAAAFAAGIALDAWAGSFADGGIVPQVAGVPSRGDKHIASVNPGELILNQAQQASIAAQLSMFSRLTDLLSAGQFSRGITIDLSGSTFNDMSEEAVGQAVYRNIKTLQAEGVLGSW